MVFHLQWLSNKAKKTVTTEFNSPQVLYNSGFVPIEVK